MNKRCEEPIGAYTMAMGLGEGVPERIHLVPAGPIRVLQPRGHIKPLDGRSLKLLSFDGRDEVDRVPVDINHAIAKRGTAGEASPAVGWITALQMQADGLWGKVEWTEAGRALIADKAYRHISAELMVPASGDILGIRGASLTNAPNLKGLRPIFNSVDEKENDDMEKISVALCALLGLQEDAQPEAILQAVTTLKTSHADLGKQMTGIARAAGVADGADVQAILQAISTGDGTVVAGLRAELNTVAGEFATLKESVNRGKAEAFVDAAIARGVVGVKPLRDHYIARHMAAGPDVEKEIAALPVLTAAGAVQQPPTADGRLSPEEAAVCRAMGIAEEDFKKTKAAEAARGVY
jgi:phage I-like protein